MQNNPIGVFDSGVGGTTILKDVQTYLPHEDFVYFGDSKNCPYGDKTAEELMKIVREATEFLLTKNVKMIIVACNTATTRTIEYLRETFPDISFIGTEPAVKPACDEKFENIFVLATEGTVRSERLHFLIERNKKSYQTVTVFPLPGLAEAIEKNNRAKINNCLSTITREYSEEMLEKVDSVVLGCTHYPIVSKKFEAIFPNAEFFDSGEGVAHQVKRVLSRRDLLSTRKTKGEIQFFFSKKRK